MRRIVRLASPRQERCIALVVALAVDGRPLYQIAGQAKISPQVICDYKAGRARPSPEAAKRLARVLGTTVEELFGPAREAVPA